MSIIRKIIRCRFKGNGYECRTAKENPKSCDSCKTYCKDLPTPMIFSSSVYMSLVAQTVEGE